MALVFIVTIVGLQAVGLILMIALLVIPAAAARFWTETMWKMIVVSGGLGALGGMIGAGISALFSKLPSGATIVLVCAVFFLLSMVFGSSRGVLVRWLRKLHLNRTIDRQHLLRAMFETIEATDGSSGPGARRSSISLDDLMGKRSWSLRRLERELARAERDGSVERTENRIRLTEQGLQEATRLTRQHRLWELYLINYADIAPSRVDRDADAIEHVLEPEIVAELESLLRKEYAGVPPSPHELALQTK
jgi:manganese/zinc/iron transport system permease protein